VRDDESKRRRNTGGMIMMGENRNTYAMRKNLW
jgi:hypothetical protein